MKNFLSGVILVLLLLPLGALFYLKFGNPPVAVADQPFPFEKLIVHIPLHARIARDMPRTVPIQPTSDNLVAGAQLYSQNCAGCHGTYRETSTFGQHLYPWAPQLLQAHGAHRVVGVSDDPAGETYWKVSNGLRLTGMPSFKQMLNPTQMWQISVMLANADKPLPQPAMDILNKPLMF
ncbi:MAG TPA: cytochrome c [Acidobacteriaceae bacterium]|nr:cytochrome c [Acidobacteriaceae bacterium]